MVKKLLIGLIFSILVISVYLSIASADTLFGPANGNVYYYSFDSSSGTNIIDSVGTKNMSINGTAYNWITGKINNAVNMSGANASTITNISSSINGSNNRTFSFWFNATSNVLTEQHLISYGNASADQAFDINFINGYWYLSRYGTDTNSTAKVTSGFNHIVVTYNGSAISFWINGINTKNATGITLNTAITPLYIFDANISAYTGKNTNGTLDELGIWNRTLSPSEILQLYNNGNGIGYGGTGINLNSPSDGSISLPSLIIFNTTVTGNNLTNVSLYTNESSWSLVNTSILINVNSTTITIDRYLGSGTYTWGINACQSDGTCFNSLNRTIIIKQFIENSQTYNSNTFSLANETFNINISYDNTSFI